MSLREDESNRPELFYWNGRIERAALDSWLQQHAVKLPMDLLQLWQERGGGQLFESENLFVPFGDPRVGDDIEGVNKLHHDQGLETRYLVFHQGLRGISAVRLDNQRYALLHLPDYAEEGSFDTLEDWYENVIRCEFSERYGLRPSSL